jgi:hypothetical protein
VGGRRGFKALIPQMAIFRNATQGDLKENQAHGLFVGCGSTHFLSS